MHPISGTLQTTVFGQTTLVAADLWTITLTNGTVLRYTDGDTAVVYGGNTFAPLVFTAGDYQGRLGAEVSSFEMTMQPGTVQVGGLPMLTVARFGGFDRARVKVERAFGATSYPSAPSEVVLVFSGVVMEVEPASVSLVLVVKSLVAIMDEPIPRRTVTPACPFILGDADCQVVMTSWTTARTIAAGTTETVLVISSSTTNAEAGGTVEITSGPYTGQRRLVRSVAGTSITLETPLPGVPANGNGVTLRAGCAKTRVACRDKFSNYNGAAILPGLRHGGCPQAPLPTSES